MIRKGKTVEYKIATQTKKTARRTDKERAKQWDGTRVRRNCLQDKTIFTKKSTIQEQLAKI